MTAVDHAAEAERALALFVPCSSADLIATANVHALLAIAAALTSAQAPTSVTVAAGGPVLHVDREGDIWHRQADGSYRCGISAETVFEAGSFAQLVERWGTR